MDHLSCFNSLIVRVMQTDYYKIWIIKSGYKIEIKYFEDKQEIDWIFDCIFLPHILGY